MKPDEGFAVAAVGLGSYVVDGWKSYRFSSRYPKIEMYSTKDLITSSQVKFYALDTSKSDADYVNDVSWPPGHVISVKLAWNTQALRISVQSRQRSD
jgi:hypothetical protein